MQNVNGSSAPASDAPAQGEDTNQTPEGLLPRRGRQPPKPRTPPSSKQSLEAIGRIMRGEDEPQDDDQGTPSGDDQGAAPGEDQGDEPQGDKRPKLKSLDQLAKVLKVDAADLYDIEVPLRAGSEKKAMKLGELKDYFDSQDDHRLERLAWDEERGRQEAAMARDRAELSDILKLVPPDKLDSKILEGIRRRQDNLVATERRRTMERIPSWRDEESRTRDLEAIAEHLRDYGFPPSVLTTITDHRMLAYMRDNVLRMRRINEALERVKPHRGATIPRSRSSASAPAQQPVRPSAGARTTLDQRVDAVSKLIRG